MHLPLLVVLVAASALADLPSCERARCLHCEVEFISRMCPTVCNACPKSAAPAVASALTPAQLPSAPVIVKPEPAPVNLPPQPAPAFRTPARSHAAPQVQAAPIQQLPAQPAAAFAAPTAQAGPAPVAPAPATPSPTLPPMVNAPSVQEISQNIYAQQPLPQTPNTASFSQQTFQPQQAAPLAQPNPQVGYNAQQSGYGQLQPQQNGFFQQQQFGAFQQPSQQASLPGLPGFPAPAQQPATTTDIFGNPMPNLFAQPAAQPASGLFNPFQPFLSQSMTAGGQGVQAGQPNAMDPFNMFAAFQQPTPAPQVPGQFGQNNQATNGQLTQQGQNGQYNNYQQAAQSQTATPTAQPLPPQQAAYAQQGQNGPYAQPINQQTPALVQQQTVSGGRQYTANVYAQGQAYNNNNQQAQQAGQQQYNGQYQQSAYNQQPQQSAQPVYQTNQVPQTAQPTAAVSQSIDANPQQAYAKPQSFLAAAGAGAAKPIAQCPSQPGWKPCIEKGLANDRFRNCCSRLGDGCLPLCNYDANLNTMQLAVLTGRCPLAKVRDIMICASGYEDATSCCEAYNVFEPGYEHCRPYCNPAAGLPEGGLLSEKYKCLVKLSQIQQCFYVSQRP